MSFLNISPSFRGPTNTVKRTGNSPAYAYFNSSKVAGNVVVVQTVESWGGIQANDYAVLVSYAGTTNRYYCQLKDPTGTTLGTVIVTTGISNLPAAVAADPTLSSYIKLRVVGSWDSTDTLVPVSAINLRGGRGY